MASARTTHSPHARRTSLPVTPRDHVCHKHHTCRGLNEGRGPSLRDWQLLGTPPFCGARSSTPLGVCGNQRAQRDPGSLERQAQALDLDSRPSAPRFQVMLGPPETRGEHKGWTEPECAGPQRRPSSPGRASSGAVMLSNAQEATFSTPGTGRRALDTVIGADEDEVRQKFSCAPLGM